MNRRGNGPLVRQNGTENEGPMSDRMVEVLRKAIQRGMLLPGEHLTQTGLAERHATSKVPVREALKQLHTEGLLQHDPNRGYFVAHLSRGEVRQLYKMRRWLESELLRSARWPNRTELKQIKGWFDTLSRPVNSGNREEWLAALSDVRATIFGLSPEKVLLREAMRLWVLTDRVRALLPDEASVTGEAGLYEALAARDRDALLAAHAADRDRIEGLLDELIETMPAYWAQD
jgi:DNA-binding GntR family transcriptional regulator